MDSRLQRCAVSFKESMTASGTSVGYFNSWLHVGIFKMTLCDDSLDLIISGQSKKDENYTKNCEVQ